MYTVRGGAFKFRTLLLRGGFSRIPECESPYRRRFYLSSSGGRTVAIPAVSRRVSSCIIDISSDATDVNLFKRVHLRRERTDLSFLSPSRVAVRFEPALLSPLLLENRNSRPKRAIEAFSDLFVRQQADSKR
jgi:hypothetical protein